MNIFVLVRAITYVTLFIGFLLVYVPGLLLGSGNARPVVIEAPQIGGMIITAAGAVISAVVPLSKQRAGSDFPNDLHARERTKKLSDNFGHSTCVILRD